MMVLTCFLLVSMHLYYTDIPESSYHHCLRCHKQMAAADDNPLQRHGYLRMFYAHPHRAGIANVVDRFQ